MRIMNREDMQNLILESMEGVDLRIILETGESKRFRNYIQRAKACGYRIILKALGGGVYYFEKSKEGNREAYKKRMVRGRPSYKNQETENISQNENVCE